MAIRWTIVGTCVEGEPFEIAPGLDVWAHDWAEVERDPPPAPTGNEIEDIRARTEKAAVLDPAYRQEHVFDVYEIVDGERRVRFAAGEFSANFWGFYLPAAS